MNAQSSPLPAPRALAVVPARLASTRLARKVLLAETGRTLLEHTARNAEASGAFERVVVAADDPEVAAACAAAGLECVATDPALPSGTDRVRAALRELGRADRYAVVVGVQADEPELAHSDLRGLVAAFADPDVEAASLAAPLDDEAAWRDPSVVKVVVGASGDALYFSRAPLPARGHGGDDPLPLARRHVGVYAWRPAALARFCALGTSALERAERLEQLRWLEAGGRMRMVPAATAPPGIDTAADYEAFAARESARSGRPDGEGGRGGTRAEETARRVG